MTWSGRACTGGSPARSDAAATKLDAMQLLTIRGYLSLVFATLVTLLLVLAIWS